MEHNGVNPEPRDQHNNTPLTVTGPGSFRSPTLRSRSERFQHFPSKYHCLKRSKSNPDHIGCIYKVPSKIRNVRFSAYTPQLLSIGFYHYGKPKLRDMESHKKIYSQNFYLRTWKGKEKLTETQKSGNLKDFIMSERERIDRCYSEYIDLKLEKNQSVEDIILVDACFIIELFLRYYEGNHDKDYILSSPWLRNAIKLDLVLFENQLPFHLLQELYNRAHPQSQSHEHERAIYIDVPDKDKPVPVVPSFLELSCKFLKEFIYGKSVKDVVKPKHFTDLVRQFMLPHLEKMKWEETKKSKYNVTMLTAAGVNFMPIGKAHDPLVVMIEDPQGSDVHGNEKEAWSSMLKFNYFRSMNLKLTPFCIKDDTECIIRNVMALEQFVYPEEAYVCNYFLMLEKLVATAEDVEFLVEKGVIINMLGTNKEVAELVNKLCAHIMEEKSCYNDICDKLNKRYENSLYRQWVSLTRVYFKDLWTGSATLFGVVLVLLTIVETVMSFRK